MPSPPPSPAPPPETRDKARPRLAAGGGRLDDRPCCCCLLAVVASQWFAVERSKIDYTFFDSAVRAHNVKSIDVQGAIAYGEFVNAPLAPVAAATPDADKTDAKDAKDTKADEKPAKEPVRLNRQVLGHAAERQRRSRVRARMARGGRRDHRVSISRRITATCCCWCGWGLLVFLVIGGWNMARRARDQMLGGGMLPGVLQEPGPALRGRRDAGHVQRRGRPGT